MIKSFRLAAVLDERLREEPNPFEWWSLCDNKRQWTREFADIALLDWLMERFPEELVIARYGDTNFIDFAGHRPATQEPLENWVIKNLSTLSV